MFAARGAFISAIGAAAVGALPRGWSKALLQIERRESSASAALFFIGRDASITEQVDPPTCIALETLALPRDAGEPWTTPTMIIERNGAFEVDYGYEPVPVENEFERRLAWEGRYPSRP